VMTPDQELMELEHSSWFQLVSSSESPTACKATALRHGFVHYSEKSCATGAQRRARSEEPRGEADQEAIAFARYVATFHFGRRGSALSHADGVLKTPTNAREKLTALTMSCGMPDDEERTAVEQVAPQGAKSFPDPQVAEVATETPLSTPRSIYSEHAIETPICSPRQFSASAPVSPMRPAVATGLQSPFEPTSRKTRANSWADVALTPTQMRADAPAFVPHPPCGPLSTVPPSTKTVAMEPPKPVQMPPVSPQAYSFLKQREAGTRVPTVPPPSSPPPPIDNGPPGAFHMPPPRGNPGCNAGLLQLHQHIPLPPTASSQLTHTLSAALEEHVQAHQLSSYTSERGRSSSNGSCSTTAPPSGEEFFAPLPPALASLKKWKGQAAGARGWKGNGAYEAMRTVSNVNHTDGSPKSSQKARAGEQHSRNVSWRAKHSSGK